MHLPSVYPRLSAKTVLILSALAAQTLFGSSAIAQEATADKPNILIIYPDDVGWMNVSAYGHGVVGYTTPNIDKLAKEGLLSLIHI